MAKRKWRKPLPREAHDPAEHVPLDPPVIALTSLDEVDRGLYARRPRRARPETMAEALGRTFRQHVPCFEMQQVQNVILPNLLHRIEWVRYGSLPDLAECLKHAPSDGCYVARATWMDKQGYGHVYLAWKETPVMLGGAGKVIA